MSGQWILILGVFGACLGFIIAWILKSENARVNIQREWEKVKGDLERNENQRVMLEDKLQACENIIKDMEESSSSGNSGLDESAQESLREMTARLKGIEDENRKLKDELNVASESLAEIYKAVYEEGNTA